MRALIRHTILLASIIRQFLKHCAWVLLHGESLVSRLWSVFVGAAPPFFWTFCFKQAKKLPDSIRPPIHIDILPWANEIILSPLGVLCLTIALVPLARAVELASREDKAEDNEGTSTLRGRAFAISILAFPTLVALTDFLGKANIRDSLDLMAFTTYGALHFASPIIAGWWIWGFGSQGAACTFGWCLGLQNLCGLATHLVFPNASPWFYDVYGGPDGPSQPDYSYPGNPAGLIRVDAILGTHIYTNAFGKSPVVFGAIPSLHAATAICCSLFVARYSTGVRGLTFMLVYCFWMFWSTQYLHHHFAIDLVVGTLYSGLAFAIADRVRLRFLDREHARRGLTNGWERLRWASVDGGYSAVSSSEMSRRSSAASLLDIGGPVGANYSPERQGTGGEPSEKV
ncbi:hypothetical protein T439DRAFT_378955 [Meredithblackwellia eburnea MCA 4105]